MKKLFAALALSALSLALVVSGNYAGGKDKDEKDKKDEKAKYTIKDVMKKAHASGLVKKVATGKASDAEKKELLGFYIALHANTPPKGEAKAWEVKTSAILDAAKAVLEGKEGAGELLLKVTNCKACHSEFK